MSEDTFKFDVDEHCPHYKECDYKDACICAPGSKTTTAVPHPFIPLHLASTHQYICSVKQVKWYCPSTLARRSPEHIHLEFEV